MEIVLLIIEGLQFALMLGAAFFIAKIHRQLSPGKPSMIEQGKEMIAADIEKAKTISKRGRPAKMVNPLG